MKKWEENKKNQVHQSRIKNVKPAVSNTGVRKSGNKSLNDSRQISSIKSPVQGIQQQDQQNSISDYYESEKNNLQSIPLYRILKLQNLQQYARELISRGFGYDLKKFNYLSNWQLDNLLNEIRVQPGHRNKLKDLLDLITNDMIPEIENNSMWNMQTPDNGSGHYYNPTLQSSGKSINKANSIKLVSTKHTHPHQIMNGKQPTSTRSNQSDRQQQSSTTSHNFLRKNSQPHVSSSNQGQVNTRNNHHMYYQGNQRQIKSQTSHIKKRSTHNIGYDYFIESHEENDGYDEFQDAIQKLVHQYNFSNNPNLYNNNDRDYQQLHHNTDESFRNEYNDIEQELDLGQNIGYKNQGQIKTKYNQVINQVSKGSGQTNTVIGKSGSQASNQSGSSISSQASSSITQASKNNNSLLNSKTNSISSSSNINSSNQQTSSSLKPTSTSKITNPQVLKQPTDTLAKPSSSQQQRRPSSGISKGGSQQSQQAINNGSNSTSQSSQSQRETINKPTSISLAKPGPIKQIEKEQIKPEIKKNINPISSTSSKQLLGESEEKTKDLQKAKILDIKQKSEIEKLKLKSSEGTRSLAQTSKDIANQLQQQNQQLTQNSSGLLKKARPQTAKYVRNISQILDDQCLIPEYDENDNLILSYKENRLIKNLRKKASKNNDQNQDELNPQLDYDTIKQMYMSFEGGKLTSTLVNLDIEEMCYCFACAIVKHIEKGEDAEKIKQNNKMYNDLHQIEEEETHDDHLSKEQNSSIKHNYNDLSYENSQMNNTHDNSNTNNNNQQNHPQNYHQQNYNNNNLYNHDTSLNRTTNPIEEPTMIQDDYNQSIINADAEKYLKDDDTEYRSGDRKYPQEFRVNEGEYNWKQKKSLSDISERTHEVSHQNNKSITVDQSNEQQQSINKKITGGSSRQFESTRQQMNEILKESFLIAAPDNKSLCRRLEVDNHADDQFEYTENEDDDYNESQINNDGDNNNNNHLKRKGFNHLHNNNPHFKHDINHSKTPFDESSLNQFQYDQLEKEDYPHSEEEDNEFLQKTAQNKQQKSSSINKNASSQIKQNDQTTSIEMNQQSFQQNDDYNEGEEVESEGEVENEDYQQEEDIQVKNDQEESQLNFSMISRYSIVLPNDDNSNKRLFDKTYNYVENSDSIFTQKPTNETIQNYCKNICINCQLEKQIPIIALVYIERLLNNSGFSITPKNWRKITITSMIMASKIWDDESFENKNFSQAYPQFGVILINEMERVFLNFIDYNLYIKGADYAKYYFILREFAQKNKKSFPLRPLDLKTILKLQNNANKAQSNLKEMYQNPLNKSF